MVKPVPGVIQRTDAKEGQIVVKPVPGVIQRADGLTTDQVRHVRADDRRGNERRRKNCGATCVEAEARWQDERGDGVEAAPEQLEDNTATRMLMRGERGSCKGLQVSVGDSN